MHDADTLLIHIHTHDSVNTQSTNINSGVNTQSNNINSGVNTHSNNINSGVNTQSTNINSGVNTQSTNITNSVNTQSTNIKIFKGGEETKRLQSSQVSWPTVDQSYCRYKKYLPILLPAEPTH